MDNKTSLTKIHSFPKIFYIGENWIENLFKGEVEITEKIDGSQWDIGITKDKQIVKRSKGEDLTFIDDVPKMFKTANDQTKRISDILIKNNLKDIYFYCEFLDKPNHNVLKYERVPKNNLYLFGVMEGLNFVSDFDILCGYADLLEIEKPNLLYKGIIKNTEELEELLNKDSCLGNERVEGIVVKNYKEPVILGSRIVPISMGKYVREDFKERHKTEWNNNFNTKGKLATFIDSFKTEARWQKAIQHLKEKGELENSPRDIGKLLIEIKRDVLEEEEQNIKNELFKIFKDNILRKSTNKFPEWYKKQLLEETFNK